MNSWDLIKKKDNKRVLVLGHRGSPLREKENTIPSFLRALEEGADGVELDVRPTQDNFLVVSHDNSLKRVYGMDIKIEETPFALLREKVPSIPLLCEVFDALGPVWYDIEIKADKPLGYRKEVITLLWDELQKKEQYWDKILLSSFNPFLMRKLDKLTSSIFPMGIIYAGENSTVPKFCQRGQGRFLFHCSFLKPEHLIAKREKKSKSNWPILPWTVDRKEDIKAMLELGIPLLISNDPKTAIKTLQEENVR